ncbi:MAG: Ldh family oxidoreductase [Burkholderiales bacterium]|nr:MAG: Ldh family oxidoreductase [Burkholderiales bacterium]
MKLTFDDAHQLATRFLVRHEMPQAHAGIVADHLIYATNAGHDFAGLSRLLPIAEQLARRGTGGDVTTLRETANSAVMDGGNVIGYVTSLMAMDKAIELAKKSGIGVVGLSNSWFSGMLRYYVERAADRDMIALHACNSTARVAPFGGIDRLLGTNPLAFACPAPGAPLVIDIGSSAMTWGDVIFHQQTGRPLPEGVAVDPEGHPTLDPASALAGAIKTWGGPRGSAIAMMVQALGILGGSDPVIGETGKWGYFFMAMDPSLLMPVDELKTRIGSMRDQIEGSRAAPDGTAVRAPGSSGTKRLQEAKERGWIDVDDAIVRAISP